MYRADALEAGMPTYDVKLYAGLQALVGSKTVALELAQGATIETLRNRIVEEYPVLESFMGTLVCAIDEEMVPPEHVLNGGERIELIPPIAGG
jgi:molybdopterin converting factor small subunit